MSRVKSKINRNIAVGIIAPFLIAMFTSCLSDQQKINRLDRFLTSIYEKGKFNGNILISKKGEILYKKTFGISNINPIDSLRVNSKFRLASMSKQFTAMGIMILKEQGQLDYNDNIKNYIPNLPYSGVTIRHLLNHTSGLPDYVNFMEANWKPHLMINDSRRFISGNNDIIKMIIEKRPNIDFAPGEEWKYSNTNYILLSTVIEKVSGVSYGEFLKKQIFEPTRMNHTEVYKYVPGVDTNEPLRVYGYMVDKNDSKNYTMDCHFLNRAQGDGGIYSTMENMYKWNEILYTNKIVSKETLDEAFTPGILNRGTPTNYGFGWFIKESPNGGKVVSHNGGWCGFRTSIYRDLDEEICIILLVNNSWDDFPYALKIIKRILY